MRRIYLGLFIFSCVYLLAVPECFSQGQEEREEKMIREMERLKAQEVENAYKAAENTQRRPLTPRVSCRVSVFSGYDSNVNLDTKRKGDVFESILFSLDYRKPITEDIKFTFDYDLYALNYNEYTDTSSILDHFRLGLQKKFSPFVIGTGYDLGMLYYPYNEDGDFLLHKGFVYLGQDILKRIYHQIQFEAGLKDYTNKKALLDTIDTYQDEKRQDKRLGVEYRLGSLVNRRLRLSFRTMFLVNDSNARYVDFYDYKAYQASSGFDYAILGNLYLISNFSYLRKNYNSRTVTLKDYRQRDNLYAGSLGLKCKVNEKNSMSLVYSYRENSSNDSLEEYSGNMITCGWQYNF